MPVDKAGVVGVFAAVGVSGTIKVSCVCIESVVGVRTESVEGREISGSGEMTRGRGIGA